MNNILWIKSGKVIDPINNRNDIGDVFVIDDKIVSDLTSQQKKEAKILDANGLVVSPGLVDIHVHLRDPGQTHKESIKTGTYSAAAGGFTTIVCMPNTSPPADNAGTIQLIKNSISSRAIVNVYPTGCMTIGQKGEKLAPIGSLKRAGVVAVTDDGLCVQNNELMRRVVEYANMFDLVVMDHCQDADLTDGSVMNEGHWSLRLGLKGWPNSAEDIIVSRNVILSKYSGAHIHLQHISSAHSIEIIREAKKNNIRITAEVTPHHISLTDEKTKDYNTNFKMNPPLRTEEDRKAIVNGLLEGVIDCISTDHAPHSDYEKDTVFDQAMFGITGLETALAVSLETLYHNKLASLPDVISWMTYKPSKILGLESGTLNIGSDADIVLFNPDEEWLVQADNFQSKSNNSPWIGDRLRGKVNRTIVKGKTVWDGKKIIS